MILENNQYPPRFYEKIIHDTLTKIVEASPKQKEEQEEPFLAVHIHHEDVENSDTIFETTNRKESEEWSYL